MPLPEETYLAALERDVAGVLDCLRDGPLDAPVDGCPGWDLRQLVVHLGRTHRWATAALGSTDEPTYAPRPDGDELGRWFGDGARRLLEALRSADPTTPCWSFSLDAGTVGFWVRRQALETVVHRWDAEQAIGRAGGIDPDLAADGVDEVAWMFYPRQVALGRRAPLGLAVTLRAADATRSDGPDGSDRSDRSHGVVVVGEGEPQAEVSGPAELLLLALWRRRSGSDLVRDGVLTVDGDRDAALRVLGEPLVP